MKDEGKSSYRWRVSVLIAAFLTVFDGLSADDAHAAVMICTITVDSTGAAVSASCTSYGDVIEVNVTISDPPLPDLPSTAISEITGSGPTGGTGNNIKQPVRSKDDSKAIESAVKMLENSDSVEKLRAVIKKLRNKKTFSNDMVKRAVKKAIQAVNRVLITRGKGIETNSKGREVVAKTVATYPPGKDPAKAPVFPTDVKIFVNGDATDKNSKEGNDNGSLDSVLKHEVIHVFIRELGLPDDMDHDIIRDSDLAPECADPDCSNQHGESETTPIRLLPKGSMEVPIRRWLAGSLRNGGGIVRETNTGRVGAFVEGTLVLRPTVVSVAAFAAEGSPVSLWDDAFKDVRGSEAAPILVDEFDGKPYFIVAGARVERPSDAALAEHGANYKKTSIWRGSSADLIPAPRDGVLIWERTGADVGKFYLMLGGAALPISDPYLTRWNIKSWKSIMLWRSALKGVRIPKDGTIFRSEPNVFWAIKNGHRFKVNSLAAAQKLLNVSGQAWPVWPGALDLIPERAVNCDLGIAIVSLGSSKITAGALNRTKLTYAITNHGLEESGKYLDVRALDNGQEIAALHWQVEGPIAPGARLVRDVEVDAYPIKVGPHTWQLGLEKSALACAPAKQRPDINSANDLSSIVKFDVLPNTAPVQSGANLRAELLSAPSQGHHATYGSYWDVRYVIRNVGTAPAVSKDGQIAISFLLDGVAWPIGGLVVKSGIAPGGSSDVGIFAVYGPSFPVGTHTIQIVVNPGKTVDESSYADNTSNALPLTLP